MTEPTESKRADTPRVERPDGELSDWDDEEPWNYFDHPRLEKQFYEDRNNGTGYQIRQAKPEGFSGERDMLNPGKVVLGEPNTLYYVEEKNKEYLPCLRTLKVGRRTQGERRGVKK